MKTKKNPVNPAAAVPQAPLSLRTSPKARAGGPPAPTPDKQKADEQDGDPDPDEDEDEDEDEEQDALASHEPLRADAEAKFKAAADAYASAKGTDSAQALMAAEDAGDAAKDAHAAAKASSMKLRGAEEPDPDSKPMAPPPAPGAAQALGTLGGPAASAQLEIASLAAGMRDVMKAYGATSVAAAVMKAQAGAVALADLAKIRAEQKATAAATDIAKRTARLAGAVQAGFDRAKAFHINEDGSPGAPLKAWSRGTYEELDETLTALGYPADAKPKGANLIASGGADEAGLAARAAASGMTLEDRRAAEANQARSAALEANRSTR